MIWENKQENYFRRCNWQHGSEIICVIPVFTLSKMILLNRNNSFIFFPAKNFINFNFWKMLISTYKKRNWASMCQSYSMFENCFQSGYSISCLSFYGDVGYWVSAICPINVRNSLGVFEFSAHISFVDTLGRILERMRKNMSFISFIAIQISKVFGIIPNGL